MAGGPRATLRRWLGCCRRSPPRRGRATAYAGRPLEERLGLSDNRARWYEPATGRFLSEDPTGFEGG
ncbi:MAG: RHS repeat-associated core domain-containing protein, partial [Planctomycetaceae bacterium]